VVRYSTFAANKAIGGRYTIFLTVVLQGPSAGGQIYQRQQSGTATLTLASDIFSGSPAGTGTDAVNDGGSASGSYNLIQLPGGGLTGLTNTVVANPLLGPIAGNGGLTPTMAITTTSPAYNAGDPNVSGAPATDQRGPGFARVVDGRIDIGAYEIQPTPVPPPGVPLFAVAVGHGSPEVKVYNPDGSLKFDFMAYASSFKGGVRVAVADVDGDGVPDIITGAGLGGGPHVEVFSGVDLHLIQNFYAFSSDFTGGVFVAGGDVNGDGKADIIVGSGTGGGSQVMVFDGATGGVLQSFAAFPGFNGGVTVASADFNGDGRADMVVAAGFGGGPHVMVLDGQSLAVLRNFFAYPSSYTGGVFVAAGDFDGDGVADIATGRFHGDGNVTLFNGGDPANGTQTVAAYPGRYRSGVRVAAVNLSGGTGEALVTGAGPLGAPQVRILAGPSFSDALPSFDAFGSRFLAGVFVG
jgi:hypothetical protein